MFLGFRGWDIADRLQQLPVVEPLHPFERGVLDGFEGPPGSASMDDLGLVEAVDRLGQGVVVAVADAADRWLDPGLGETLGIFDRDILAAAIAVVNEPAPMCRPAIMKGLFQRIEDEAGMRRPAGRSAWRRC